MQKQNFPGLEYATVQMKLFGGGFGGGGGQEKTSMEDEVWKLFLARKKK